MSNKWHFTFYKIRYLFKGHVISGEKRTFSMHINYFVFAFCHTYWIVIYITQRTLAINFTHCDAKDPLPYLCATSAYKLNFNLGEQKTLIIQYPTQKSICHSFLDKSICIYTQNFYSYVLQVVS